MKDRLSQISLDKQSHALATVSSPSDLIRRNTLPLGLSLYRAIYKILLIPLFLTYMEMLHIRIVVQYTAPAQKSYQLHFESLRSLLDRFYPHNVVVNVDKFISATSCFTCLSCLVEKYDFRSDLIRLPSLTGIYSHNPAPKIVRQVSVQCCS